MTCGENGGITARGTPCKMPAQDGGRCTHHEGQRILRVVPRSDPFEPGDLSEEPRAIWDMYADRLEARQRAGLKLMCMGLEFALRAGRDLEDGLTLEDPVHGENRKKNPAWQIFRDAQAVFKGWTEHFEGKLKERSDKSAMEKLLGR